VANGRAARPGDVDPPRVAIALCPGCGDDGPHVAVASDAGGYEVECRGCVMLFDVGLEHLA
jgi:hypothetical protein